MNRPSVHGTLASVAVALLLTVALGVPTAHAETSPCVSTPRAPFRDVSDAAVHAFAIDCLFWYEIADGVAHDRFAPLDPLPRGQVASLLDRIVASIDEPLPEPPASRFTDTGMVHGPAIERLAAAGIVSGVTDTTYRPDLPVRRDQLASLLVATHDHLTGDLATDRTVDGHGFDDLDGNIHAAAIAAAIELDLLAGTRPVIFDPASPATRAQTATVLSALFERAGNLPGASATSRPAPGGPAVRIRALPTSLRAEVERWTWRAGCPVPPADLRLVEVVHVDFHGAHRWGQLVVRHDVAGDVGAAFGTLYAAGFPIARMQPVERFRGDDDASMAANNTSAFNCRRTTGGSGFSEHASGTAIDINPVQNPYVRGSTVLPSGGRDYLDRGRLRPGMLTRPGAVTAFDAIGWGWGGDFRTLKDYQHLSLTGR